MIMIMIPPLPCLLFVTPLPFPFPLLHTFLPHLCSQASPLDLRSALESLPDVTSVAVTRTPSADLLPNSLVTLVPGSLTLTCALASCDFSLLPPGEMIRVNGQWFKVSSDYAGSPSSLPLALANDSSVKTAYTGLAATSVPLYRWARGYEWAVTFLSVTNMATAGTAAVMPLTSPKHGNQATLSLSPPLPLPPVINTALK